MAGSQPAGCWAGHPHPHRRGGHRFRKGPGRGRLQWSRRRAAVCGDDTIGWTAAEGRGRLRSRGSGGMVAGGATNGDLARPPPRRRRNEIE